MTIDSPFFCWESLMGRNEHKKRPRSKGWWAAVLAALLATSAVMYPEIAKEFAKGLVRHLVDRPSDNPGRGGLTIATRNCSDCGNVIEKTFIINILAREDVPEQVAVFLKKIAKEPVNEHELRRGDSRSLAFEERWGPHDWPIPAQAQIYIPATSKTLARNGDEPAKPVTSPQKPKLPRWEYVEVVPNSQGDAGEDGGTHLEVRSCWPKGRPPECSIYSNKDRESHPVYGKSISGDPKSLRLILPD
jgi:hypothetical protein